MDTIGKLKLAGIGCSIIGAGLTIAQQFLTGKALIEKSNDKEEAEKTEEEEES